MSKSRLFSGKIKKLSSGKLTADRYEYLDASQAEPDLGAPVRNGSVLTGSTTSNVRSWNDILTVDGATVRIWSTLTNIGFYTPNALVVDGGIGVAGDINILGKALINNVEVLTTQSGLTSQFGQSIINLTLKITTSTNSTGTSSGALVVYGGVGINKDLYVGGTTYAGNIYSNGSLVGSSTGTTSTFIIVNNTVATSTSTGALQVRGGVGVGGSLFVNNTSYIAGAQIITTATINNYANQTAITAGTDTAVNTSTGNITIWNTSTLQSVTNRGNSTTNAISIINYTSATSTNTGALVVSGGVGVGGDIYAAGDIFTKGQKVITTATVNDYADKTVIYAGTDTAVNTSTGNITIWNTSNLQTITDRGNSTTNIVLITNGTISHGPTDGALVVSGGVGVFGEIYAGGDIFTKGQKVITTSTVNDYADKTFIYAGTDTAVNTSTGNITIWNTSTLQTITDRGNSTTNRLLVINTTSSTSTTTGALIISGGVGIGKDLWIGGNVRLASGANLSIGNQAVVPTLITAGTDTAVNTSTGNITIWNTSTLQTITNRGQTTTNAISITNTSTSTTPTTGALVVTGGVGIGENLYVGNRLAVLNTLSSTSSIYQNAAYIEGGLGVGKSLYVTGEAIFQNNVTFLGTTTYVLTTNTVYTDNLLELHYPSNPDHLWTVDDGLDIGFRFHYYDAGDQNAGLVLSGQEKYLEWYSKGNEDSTSSFTGSTFGTFRTGNIILTNTTTSTSTNTGALTVNGGVGIGGNLNVGGNIVGGGVRSTSSSTAPIVATIGDIWYNTTNDKLYRYTTNSVSNFWLDFTGQKVKYLKNLIDQIKTSMIEYLVVAGGGGGGTGQGGGGGAGGLLTNLGLTGFAVSSGTTYVVTVGSGGAPGVSLGSKGTNGDSSSFDTITAAGGGGGGAVGNGNGQAGGSGGGGASTNSGSTGGPSSPSSPFQGYVGGAVVNGNAPNLGAGGGGAGQPGTDGGGFGNGAGGNGVSSGITGSTIYYAAGGGGGLYTSGTAGSGGIGGGGNGSSSNIAGTNGTMNRGGGGGGGGNSNGTQGGKGVVIIRYPSSYLGPTSVVGATILVNNGYRIYIWNSSGSITF